MAYQYDPEYIEQHYDAAPDREWERFVRTPGEEVKLHVHNHYLHCHLSRGQRVLEIGAGPGRFTQTLHELGCRIVVGDISSEQLAANRQRADELEFTDSIERWVKADICDLSVFDSESFDAVVAYGGPLSYVFERVDEALEECFRVLVPGGVLLASVMSLWGTLHRFLRGVMEIPMENNRMILRTGNLTPDTEPGNQHPCHLFRAHELSDVVQCAGFTNIALSASNMISTHHDELLETVKQQSAAWNALREFEVEACASPGCVESGTHMIVMAKKPAKDAEDANL